MIGLASVGVIVLTVFWLGRLVERQRWVAGRSPRLPQTPACPYCRARTGFQCLGVQQVEFSAICRTCLRQVDPVRIRWR